MIHIDGDWYIEVEEDCYTLKRLCGTRKDKKGNEVADYDSHTYHATLINTVRAYLRKKTAETLRGGEWELTEALKRLTEEFERVDDRLKEILHEDIK